MAESWTLINQRSDEGLIDPKWMAYQKEDFRIAGKQGKFGIMHEQNSAYASQNNYPNFPEGEWMIIEATVCPQGKKFIGPEVRGLRIWCNNKQLSELTFTAGYKRGVWVFPHSFLLCLYISCVQTKSALIGVKKSKRTPASRQTAPWTTLGSL